MPPVAAGLTSLFLAERLRNEMQKNVENVQSRPSPVHEIDVSARPGRAACNILWVAPLQPLRLTDGSRGSTPAISAKRAASRSPKEEASSGFSAPECSADDRRASATLASPRMQLAAS